MKVSASQRSSYLQLGYIKNVQILVTPFYFVQDYESKPN